MPLPWRLGEGSGPVKVQPSSSPPPRSGFLRWRSQFDDLLLRGLPDNVWGQKGTCAGRKATAGRPTRPLLLVPNPRAPGIAVGGAGAPTFVLLGTGDPGELGVQLILLRDLQDAGSVVHHHGEEVGAAGDLKDVLDVREVIWGGGGWGQPRGARGAGRPGPQQLGRGLQAEQQGRQGAGLAVAPPA